MRGSEYRGSLLVLAGGAAAVAVAAGLSYAGFAYSRKRRVDRVLKQYSNALRLTTPQLKRIRDDMLNQSQAALRGDPSSLLMLASMVDILPDGNETGDVYAVDIGGTNFRTLYVRLSEARGQVDEVDLQEYAIEDYHFTCHATELFDLLARRIVEFVRKEGRAYPSDHKPTVGFCFSFPVEQTDLASGKLIRWTKRFENEGAVDADPVELLHSALKRQEMPAHVSVLLNDAVGTFAGGRYEDEDVMMGVIMGTGTNACYVEKRSNIHHAKLPSDAHGDSMIINTEWGGFHGESLPLLDEDIELDFASVNPGEAIFEKLVSGMYMGEVARRVFVQLVEQGSLFGGRMPPKLQETNGFQTASMAQIHADNTWLLSDVANVLDTALGVGSWQTTYFERQQVQEVCRLVCERSARLLAAGMAALLRQMGRDGSEEPAPRTAVVIDGGVAKHYTQHRELLRVGLRDLLGGSAAARVALTTVRDASSMGAAYLAAAAAAKGKCTVEQG